MTTPYVGTYRAYTDAKQRCSNPKHKRYHDWGGRGIKMKFYSFAHFLDELGIRPEGHQLDRINNDGHYEPGNVRWVTRSINQLNKRVSKDNATGVTGVRLISNTWQAYHNKDHKFVQLYAGKDFFEACCKRKSFDATLP